MAEVMASPSNSDLSSENDTFPPDYIVISTSDSETVLPDAILISSDSDSENLMNVRCAMCPAADSCDSKQIVCSTQKKTPRQVLL